MKKVFLALVALWATSVSAQQIFHVHDELLPELRALEIVSTLAEHEYGALWVYSQDRTCSVLPWTSGIKRGHVDSIAFDASDSIAALHRLRICAYIMMEDVHTHPLAMLARARKGMLNAIERSRLEEIGIDPDFLSGALHPHRFDLPPSWEDLRYLIARTKKSGGAHGIRMRVIGPENTWLLYACPACGTEAEHATRETEMRVRKAQIAYVIAHNASEGHFQSLPEYDDLIRAYARAGVYARAHKRGGS